MKEVEEDDSPESKVSKVQGGGSYLSYGQRFRGEKVIGGRAHHPFILYNVLSSNITLSGKTKIASSSYVILLSKGGVP